MFDKQRTSFCMCESALCAQSEMNHKKKKKNVLFVQLALRAAKGQTKKESKEKTTALERSATNSMGCVRLIRAIVKIKSTKYFCTK